MLAEVVELSLLERAAGADRALTVAPAAADEVVSAEHVVAEVRLQALSPSGGGGLVVVIGLLPEVAFGENEPARLRVGPDD